MSPNKKIRRCVLYVRISLSTEESVSIERQVEAGQQYAAARGWDVVGVFKDEGVSATHNKPEERKGWQDLMASPNPFDAVVIWKVDRLARRVLDFLTANEAVKARGAGIVAVEDPIDMTTAQGEAFAIMLAVFGQMEAATIRARVKAARAYLLQSGRYVGGAVLYGYRAVENPDGPGYVLAQDDEQIEYVKGMVRRTLAGLSIYSTTQWLDEVGAPTKTGVSNWSYNTVDRILRHPLLAGMVPHNPGHADRLNRRGEGVVCNEDGLPVVDPSLAIMPVGQWRAMQKKLAEPTPQRTPRAMRRKSSGVLSGLMMCGDPSHDEPVRMWRGTTGSGATQRPAYTCPTCFQTISNAEGLVIEAFLRERGDVIHLNMVEEVVEGGSVQHQEATVRLAELGREIASATAERAGEILTQMARLKEIQEEAKGQPALTRFVPVGGEARTYAEDWASAEDDEARRAILGHALDRVVVRRGQQGGWTDRAKLARMTMEWHPAGQVDTPTDAELAAWAEER